MALVWEEAMKSGSAYGGRRGFRPAKATLS